tara:strand:+ start:458 stop:1351 length:894 start_codon:yes stop_codon:yes gene_type:complete
MAYIGKQPTVGNFQVCDAISVVNGQAAYTMQVNSTNVEPETANHMLVSLNGVLQKPGSSFTISGSTITFASNLATGDVIDFIILLGDVLNIGAPSDDTVTAAKLNNDIISGQTELAATPADTDELLISDAGTIKRIDFSHLKTGITEADAFRISADQNGDSSPITGNIERVDDGTFSKIGTGMSVSSGIFTFPSTGLYYITFTFSIQIDANNDASMICEIVGTSNNSTYDTLAEGALSGTTGDHQNQQCQIETFFNCTDTSTHKVRFDVNSMNDNNMKGSTSETKSGFTFIRLGDSQ